MGGPNRGGLVLHPSNFKVANRNYHCLLWSHPMQAEAVTKITR